MELKDDIPKVVVWTEHKWCLVLVPGKTTLDVIFGKEQRPADPALFTDVCQCVCVLAYVRTKRVSVAKCTLMLEGEAYIDSRLVYLLNSSQSRDILFLILTADHFHRNFTAILVHIDR